MFSEPYCTKERKKGVYDGCGSTTVQDKVPHLIANQVSGSDNTELPI